MLVLVAITIVLLLITAAFSVDVAFMQLTRTELRTSTDAAARAATEALSRFQSMAAATQAARDAAAANLVAGEPLLLADDDIKFGHANHLGDGSFDFNEGGQPINSVRINGRRTADSPSGPVGLLFAGVFRQRTFVPSYVSRTVNLDRDICLVVDRSGSMNRSVTTSFPPPGAPDPCDRPDPLNSRWAALSAAVQSFIGGVNQTSQNELLALVSYSSDDVLCGRRYLASTIDARLDADYTLVISAMNTMSNNPIQGWTNIAAGIDNGTVVLTDATRARPFAEKTMIVLTDGRKNRGRSVVDAAADAAAQGITVHTITFSSEAEQWRMINAANAGGGKHFHAPSAAELDRIFREIALTLPVVMTE
jgi:hypothetical protein